MGTVTFFRSDVVGSMSMVRALGAAWDRVNADHLAIITGAVEAEAGAVVRIEGDAIFAVFAEAGAAVAAAVKAQRGLDAHSWPTDPPVTVRIGLHSGEAHLAGADYGGFDVNRAARVAACAHGGQVILSGPTTALVADDLPDGVTLRDLGRHTLRDVPRPEHISQLVIPGLPSDFPPLVTSTGAPGNLPARRTSFVGREDDLTLAIRLMGSTRLLTLTGPGGIGKTSLGVEVARAVSPEAPDGAWFVDLSEVAEASQVMAVTAQALGLHDGTERSAADALPAFLAERSTILVLDNFEHVLDAADAVGGLLRASPATRIIATSRAALRLTGEQELRVPPLPLGGAEAAGSPARGARAGDAPARGAPARDAPAAAPPAGAKLLFIERARAVRAGWEPSADDGVVIDGICASLDGLPLGIELAAARVGVLPLPVIRDRLAAHLPLPGPGPRDVPDRQRTLDGAVAWSHDLLDPELQTVFRQLAVFEGGFDLEQAELVVQAAGTDTLDALIRLADQSLISPDPAAPERLRFRMLQTIQAFAAARLASSDALTEVRRRHAEAFAQLVEATAPLMTTSSQPSAMDRLQPDDRNIRAAIRSAIDDADVGIAQRILAGSWRYWNASGQLGLMATQADEVLAMSGADDVTRLRMWAVGAAGSIAYWQADSLRARELYREELRLARILDDAVGLADATANLGSVAFIDRPDEQELRRQMDEAAALYDAVGDQRSVARMYFARGLISVQAGRFEESREVMTAALATFEANDDPQYHAMGLGMLASAAFLMGDTQTAMRNAVDAIIESYAMRDVAGTTISLQIAVLVAVLMDRPEDAVRLSGAFDALTLRYGVRPPADFGAFIGEIDPVGMARERVTTDRYEDLYAEGRAMSLADAVAVVADIGQSARASA